MYAHRSMLRRFTGASTNRYCLTSPAARDNATADATADEIAAQARTQPRTRLRPPLLPTRSCNGAHTRRTRSNTRASDERHLMRTSRPAVAGLPVIETLRELPT